MIAFMLSSCGGEALENIGEEKVPLRISAQFAEILSSRGYESGPVTSGKYYLSYPNASAQGAYSLATVDFQFQDVTPGIGIVMTQNNEELSWAEVEGNQPNFYLDNVPIQNSSQDPMIVTFDNTYNPFIAGVFDDEGKNDLLWGSKSVNRNTKTINFDLHHYMARLKVVVTVDETYAADDELSLEGATVYITKLQQTPVAYNRLDGSLELREDDYTSLYLVKDGLNWGVIETEVEGNEPDGGDSSETSEITTYITQDFVLPPQVLQEGEGRPRLYIKLQNGKEFSGVIPYAMYVNDNEYPENYPMTLSFLKEHILTISTRISSEPPELVFMPVLLVEWVDKGTFDLDAHQAGIYIAQEFYNLIKFYNSDADSRDYQLQRYGSYSVIDGNPTWNFNLWSSIMLDYDIIAGEMVPGNDKPDFNFIFNGYSVFIDYNDGKEPKAVTPQELYKILKGN
ncbi:MAG: fimbrillin family protein [Muribaculaceae bacterium]|nr:fimbrillin family protein [Muribaculaceae bacterium]